MMQKENMLDTAECEERIWKYSIAVQEAKKIMRLRV